MVNNKRSVLGIITLILAILGVGLGAYSLYSSLTISSQQPEVHQHMARAYLNSTYYILGEFWYKVNFTVLDYNVGGNFDLDTDVFTCTYAGYYLISGMVSLGVLEAGDEMYLTIIRNNSTLMAGTVVHASHTGMISASIGDVLYLNVGDIIELHVWHTYSLQTYVYGAPNETYTYLSIALIEN